MFVNFVYLCQNFTLKCEASFKFLADSSSKSKKKIDILIGAEHYYRFIFGNVIRGKVNESITIESVFGWVLTGYYDSIVFK